MYFDDETRTINNVKSINIDGFTITVGDYNLHLDPTKYNTNDVFIRGDKDEWLTVTAYDDDEFIWEMTVSDINILNEDEFTFITEDYRIDSFYLEEGFNLVISERD